MWMSNKKCPKPIPTRITSSQIHKWLESTSTMTILIKSYKIILNLILTTIVLMNILLPILAMVILNHIRNWSKTNINKILEQ